MADINVEHFYKDVARIFNILYTVFPTKTAIYVDDIAGVDLPDDYGLHSPRYTAGFYALLWLADEGFLNYSDTVRQDGIDQAVLTQKAFMKLSAISPPLFEELPEDVDESPEEPDEEEQFPPSIVEDRMLVINQLRAAVRARSSIAIGKVIQHILT